MWYEMADKKQWKRYVGYALFLFLSYSIGNAAAVVSTMTLQPEKVEKEMKTVAITFDDGPNPEYTPKLLDGLEKRGVKATFFLLGEEVKQYPDVVRRMHDDGHLIGVHSYKHVLWNVDPRDWATTDADTVVQRVLKDTKPGDIILLHDASASSVQAAFTVIDTLQKQGYSFVTVEELLLE